MTRDEYEVQPKRCKRCNAVLIWEKRRGDFCSMSCSASFNNQGKARHFKHSDVCECGNRKKRNNKYCAECIEKRVYQKPTLEASKSDKYRRQYLIETRGYRCEECGVSEWRGERLPLELHHIDGDSDHNSEKNLVLLCPNCHAIKPTHKHRNLKNGKRQQMRRQRYADGNTW